MVAPVMQPASSYSTRTYLPKRDELLLRIVFALPNASSTGSESDTCASTE